MLLSKVIKISNVGRLTDLVAKGDVGFSKLTLIFGLNGKGKTTLASILRSLQSGDATHIDERATLGSGVPPETTLLLSDGKNEFKNGSWQRCKPELEIFDSYFVNENVYTGESIDQDHRKNLYQVVVGSVAVKLAKRVDDLDSDGRQVSRQMTEVEDKLRQYIQAPFDLEEFIKLASEENVAQRISDHTARLNAVRKDQQVLARQQLEELTAPNFPASTLGLLKTGVAKLAEKTSQKVQTHFSSLGVGGEQWIRQGTSFLHDKNCPFCGQDISGIDLIQLFQQYFSDSYKSHVVAIQQAINEIQQTFGDESLGRLTKREFENKARVASWSDLTSLSSASFDMEKIELTWRHLRQVVLSRLQQKLAQPGNVLGDDPEVQAAILDYANASASLLKHNDKIKEANVQIAMIKKQSASTEAPVLEAELRRLRNIQIRAQPEVAELCSQLLKNRSRKKELDDEKKKTKAELEAQAGSLLAIYEKEINRLLEQFGASFGITGTKPSFAGGKASSIYQIAINNVSVDLGDSKTPKGKPCFRTALSSGDKSTLALAFFIARLRQDPSIKTKVVVFDDPLSSLDAFRVLCTQQEVCRVADLADQVIVLSHDANFLIGIDDLSVNREVKTLEFVREGATNTLRVWDLKDYILKTNHRDYLILKEFLANGVPKGGDIIQIARSVRPLIEGNLRSRYPDEYGPHETLGNFIDRIKAASPGTTLAGIQAKASELTDLNEYARRFAHSGVAVSPATTTDDELRAYTLRAMKLVQGMA